MREGDPHSFGTETALTDDPLETLIARLADEYLERVDRGETPDVEEYVARWPGDARILRQAFAALKLTRFSSVVAAANRAMATADSTERLGDFRLLGELGRGGMGVVYEAEQVSLGRRVALKILPFAGVLDARQLQRFKNEALAAAQLDHPNIVDVIAVGCERGVHFYAMRLVEGPTLAQVIAELRKSSAVEDTLPGPAKAQNLRPKTSHGNPRSTVPGLSTESPREYCRGVTRIMADLAAALDHAHQQGIVHRDVKPSNVLLDARGKAWVTDFGLARLESAGELTMTGDLLGTLRYMSPEQAGGDRRSIDHRTDVYSLGATLYELLTLKPAFAADDREKLLRRIALDAPRSPRKLVKTLPIELETIVLKALEKKPADRYATAGKLAEDLQRFLDHRPIHARRSRIAAQAKSLWRRHQVPLVAVLTTLLIASMIACVLVWRQRQEAVAQRALVIERDADLRRRVYAADMSAAHQAWQRGDVARAKELLDRYAGSADEELREFSWGHLSSLLMARPAPMTVLRPGHRNIYCVQFSPDGTLLAAACGDGHVQLWNVAGWSPRQALKAHQADADCLAFSPDGKLLASGGEDGWLRFWNVETGELVRSIDAHQKDTLTIAISPDGRTLAAGGTDGMVRLWRMPECELRDAYRASGGRVQHLAFSPDGKTLATAGGDGGSMVVDTTTCERLFGLPSQSMASYAVSFSADRHRLAIGSGSGLIALVDASTGHTEHQFGIRPAAIRAVALSPHGQRLASAGVAGVVDVWDTNTRSLSARLYSQEGCVWSLCFSPDGNLLASANDEGSVHVWDPTVESGLLHVGDTVPIREVKFGPDGNSLLTVDDSRQLVTRDATKLDILSTTPIAETPERFVVTPDRRKYAFFGEKGEVWLGDFSGADPIRFDAALKAPVKQMALARGGRLLLWYGDGTLEVWDTEAVSLLDRRQLAKGPNSEAGTVSRDGRLAAAPCQAGLLVYDVDALAPRFDQYKGELFGLAISPDNRLLAAGQRDGSILLLDTVTGDTVFSLIGHQHWVDAIAFSSDGRTLAAASRDSVVRLWDLGTREESFVLRRLESNGPLRIDFSLDGRRLAAASSDREGHGHLYLWSTSAPSPTAPASRYPGSE